MHRLSICLLLPLLLALVACPKQDAPGATQELPGVADDGGDHKPKVVASTPIADPDMIQIWTEPVLVKPLEAFERQWFISRGERIQFTEAQVADIRALKDQPRDQQPAIVIFADPEAIPELAADGVIAESTARTFAGDRLVLAARKDSGYATPTLMDTYRLPFEQLGYASDVSALGPPSYQAMVSDGLLRRIEDKVIAFDSVAELTMAIEMGQIDLAILPSSTATRLKAATPILIIDEDLHEDIRYIAAATQRGAEDATALKLLQMLAEDEQLQQDFIELGLIDRATAMLEN